MILYLQKVRELLKKFVLVQVKHVPRTGNSRADALAKLVTAPQEDLSNSTPVEYLEEPSIDLCDVQVFQIGSEPSWIEPIWDYLIDGRLPDDSKEAAKSGRGQPDSLIIKEAYTNEASSHPCLNASRERT